MPPETLGILLLSGGHERAHYAFLVASGAAAIGRVVTLFASNEGCLALALDWSRIDDAARDASVRAQGVAGLAELREASIELGVRLLACDSGLAMAGLDPQSLLPQVEVTGVPAFLGAIGAGAIVTF